MNFSIIIPVYQEKNINRLLKRLLEQDIPKNTSLKKIIVVACGYKDFSFVKDEKIMIIKEIERKGKAFAINSGLKKTGDSDTVVVISGDVLPQKNTIKNLLKPFSNPNVGMVGGRPIPLNDKKKFMGFIVHLIWNLLHQVSLKKAKTGEIVAFRNVIKKIPVESAVDEASIEAEIQERGYTIAYAPDAVVYMKGPETISDLIKQRKRIFIGHLHLKNTKGYEVSTMSIMRILESFKRIFRMNWKWVTWSLFAVLLESYARLSAMFDFYVLKKNPYKWEIIRTSKNLEVV